MEKKTKIEKKTPYHQQAYDLIKSMILSGDLSCGDKVNELTLAQELGISRSPIREAMRMLERDNLIVTNGGTHFVNPMDEETIIDVYECRISLESYATRLATEHFTQADYDKLMDYLQKIKEARIREDKWALIYLNTYYHEHIVTLSCNRYLIELISRIRDIVILSRIKELENTDISYADSDHLEIAKALNAHDADLAERLMKEHLENNLKSFIHEGRVSI